MKGKPQLVLDIGGVLVTNLTPAFWQEIARIAQTPYDSVRHSYKQEMREGLWSGKVAETDFWDWLGTHFPMINRDYAQSLLQKNLMPLPAMEYIARWSKLADIHLLSNHRAEWIVHSIQPIQDFLQSITISSEIGYAKPQPEIYNKIFEHVHPEQFILFIDDQEKNLQQASILGWHTLLADENGAWIEQVAPLLTGAL